MQMIKLEVSQSLYCLFLCGQFWCRRCVFWWKMGQLHRLGWFLHRIWILKSSAGYTDESGASLELDPEPSRITPLFFEPANESGAYLGLAPGASRFSVVVSTGNWFYRSLDLDWLWKRNYVFLDLGWSAKCGQLDSLFILLIELCTVCFCHFIGDCKMGWMNVCCSLLFLSLWRSVLSLALPVAWSFL